MRYKRDSRELSYDHSKANHKQIEREVEQMRPRHNDRIPSICERAWEWAHKFEL